MEELYILQLTEYLIPIIFFNLIWIIFMPHLFECMLTNENIFITMF